MVGRRPSRAVAPVGHARGVAPTDLPVRSSGHRPAVRPTPTKDGSQRSDHLTIRRFGDAIPRNVRTTATLRPWARARRRLRARRRPQDRRDVPWFWNSARQPQTGWGREVAEVPIGRSDRRWFETFAVTALGARHDPVSAARPQGRGTAPGARPAAWRSASRRAAGTVTETHRQRYDGGHEAIPPFHHPRRRRRS